MQSNFSALYNFLNDKTFLLKKLNKWNRNRNGKNGKLSYSKLKLKTNKEVPEVTDGDITIGCNQQNKNKV